MPMELQYFYCVKSTIILSLNFSIVSSQYNSLSSLRIIRNGNDMLSKLASDFDDDDDEQMGSLHVPLVTTPPTSDDICLSYVIRR